MRNLPPGRAVVPAAPREAARGRQDPHRHLRLDLCPWRGRFYPPGLPRKRELAFAPGTSPPSRSTAPSIACSTRRASPPGAPATDDFIFALKGSRYITHFLRLKEIETPLANFLASGPLRLDARLGPILWQFPPRMRFDPGRFGAFLELLPRDTEAALDLARRHDARVEARAWLRIDCKRPMRHAVEIRHDSFRDPAFIELLRRHKVALVCADTVDWPRLMDLTTDFVYLRLHGSEELTSALPRPGGAPARLPLGNGLAR